MRLFWADFDISQLLKALLPVDWCQSISIINSVRGVCLFCILIFDFAHGSAKSEFYSWKLTIQIHWASAGPRGFEQPFLNFYLSLSDSESVKLDLYFAFCILYFDLSLSHWESVKLETSWLILWQDKGPHLHTMHRIFNWRNKYYQPSKINAQCNFFH